MTTPNACPDWCQLWSGHECDHAMAGDRFLTTRDEMVWLEVCSTGSDEPYAVLSLEDGRIRLSAADLRQLADVLDTVAQRVDKLGATVSRRHLAIVTELGR